MSGGCPSSRMMDFSTEESKNETQSVEVKSQLKQWPIQMHLIMPTAPYYMEKDVVLAADCVAFSHGNFHNGFLKGKSIGIACPKLDSDQDVYVEKIRDWIDDAKINTLTVAIMQVPCCFGLLNLAEQAAQSATRKIPIKKVVVGVQGDILQEEWLK